MVNSLKNILSSIVFCSFAFSNYAFSQTIDTNRTGFTYSPRVVEPGRWQLEAGATSVRTSDGSWTSSLPTAELRAGVSDGVEVFLTSVSWQKTEASSGLVDMALATKINISDAADRTQLAFMFELSIPTGNSEFSSDRWDPSMSFVWLHSGDITIQGQVQVTQHHDGFQLDNGFTFPHRWNDKHSGFLEWEANVPEHGEIANWFNFGHYWLIDDHLQLDFDVGIGLSDAADNYRFDVGFSILL